MTDRPSQEVPRVSPRFSPEQRSRYGQYLSVSSASGINFEESEEVRSDTGHFRPCADLASIFTSLRSHLPLSPFFPTNKPLESVHEERRRRASRMWKWAGIGLSTIVLLWTGYCTVRYFIAFRIHGDDSVRSLFALGMAIASLFTVIFFASEAALLLRVFKFHRHSMITNLTIHSLAYLSSAMIIGLSIINLILLHLWQPADQKSHSIQGRCNWDVDIVWSGNGLSCTEEHAASFGDWLGAAIFRLVISLIILVAYHFAVHRCLSAYGERTPFRTDMEQVSPQRPSRRSGNTPLMHSHNRRPSGQSSPGPFVETIILSEEDHQRRSLSFTAAGQVLSRIEDYTEQNSDSGSESDSIRGVEDVDNRKTPDPIQGLSAYDVQGSSSSSYGGMALPSNDLQDMASTFQSLASVAMQETDEAMLDRHPVYPPSTVRILGSNISRMSTISSMDSREAGSPVSTREESPIPRRNSNKSGSQRQDSSDVLQSPSRQQTRSPTPPVAGPSRRGTGSSTLPSRRGTASSLPSRRDTGSPSPIQSDTGPLPPSQYDAGSLPPSRKNTGSSLAHHDSGSRPPSRLSSASPSLIHHDISELEGL
ncbi:hypothetical protein BU17DRAFT_98875 [Hysterangium stoloniferum]|nr:hypothetical protein BU17DRAFT_98875 [Hysterangium stoloniferum]